MKVKITCKCGASLEVEASVHYSNGFARTQEVDSATKAIVAFQEKHKCYEIKECDGPLPLFEGEDIELPPLDEPEYEPDLTKCPRCGGPADNGHDRSMPPAPYVCTKCEKEYGETDD